MFDTQELPAAEVPAALPLPAPSSQPVHLLDRLSALFKHRRIAGTAFVLVVTAMMIQTYSTIPIYQASSRVLIEDERTTQVANLNGNDPMFWQDADQYYKTQYSILQSRSLAQRVVRRLDLAHHPDFSGNGPRPRDPISLVRRGRAAASTWIRSLIMRAQKPAEPAPPAVEESQDAGLANAFLGGVTIVPEQGTRLVTIIYRHSNPELAAQAANALAEEYAQQNLDLRLQNTDKMLAWVTGELKRQEDQLAASEADLTKYRESKNALSLGDRQNIVVQRLNTLNDSVIRARTTRLSKETAFNQVKGADPNNDAIDTFPVIGANPAVVEAKNKLLAAQAEKASLVSRNFGPEWPAMKAADAAIGAAHRQLVAERTNVIESIKNEYNASVLDERNLAGSLEEAKGASMDLDRKSGDYRILERKTDSDRQVYQSLLAQQKELRVVANSRANNVQVMERGDVPRFPISPNPRRDWITAILAGLTIAIGLAFGIEYMDDSVKTPEDITRRLKIPLLGLVPSVRGERVLLTEAVPHDFGEAFRSLRTSLVFTSAAERTRIIGVTSSQPLEGKTTTAANLALALALGGSRVLLIDADMRRPGLHKTIGLQNEIGLSHLLVGQARVREAVQRTSEPNLVAITAGRTPPNPSELLASERMNNFLANLGTGPFDWVIVDTPPVLAVTDAVILAPRMSSIVFVVGSEMTRRVHAERALETLRASRPRSISAVLNRVDFDRNKYYYSRYYGYQYKNYYGNSQDQGAA
jgi:capsular exopolysaccharide synthesis family protein